MIDCIYTAHCMEKFCDKSCPVLVQTSYLLERNGLLISSPVFYKYPQYIDDMLLRLDKDDSVQIVSPCGPKNKRELTPTETAQLLTYCAICKHWKGSQLHCTVYNLKFSTYLDELKKSWSSSNTDKVDMMKIWAESAKVLIISNLEYVNFKDFESQTILTLVDQRRSSGLQTFIVSESSISYSGAFGGKVKEFLTKGEWR